MNNKKSLIIGEGIFSFFVIVSMGCLVLTQKKDEIMKPKIEKKINTYLSTNLSNIQNNMQKDDLEYDNNIYTVKISSKKNKNHFFYVRYSNDTKEISNTYKEDYEEGKQLLSYISDKLEKEIFNQINKKCKITFTSKLNEYTKEVQDEIIKENNINSLKVYTLEEKITINKWDKKNITLEIVNSLKEYSKSNIKPKNYTIIITNKDDITQSIEISNITEEFIDNKYNESIIDNILNNEETQILKNSKIKYKHLN